MTENFNSKEEKQREELELLLRYELRPERARADYDKVLRGRVKPEVVAEEGRKHGLEISEEDQELLRDVTVAKYAFGVKESEYFLFGFADKSDRERAEYLGGLLYWHKVREKKTSRDKIYKKFVYEKFSDFIHRKWIQCERAYDFLEFARFCEGKESIFVKPDKGSCGIGAKKIELSGKNILSIFQEVMKIVPVIVEEVIEQDERMARFHPKSLNTVRIVSTLHEGEVKFLWSYARFGRNGSVVDNASAGGYYSMVDCKTGEFLTDGLCKSGNDCEFHPETGIRFKGFRFPRWEDVLVLTKEAHQSYPDHFIFGWDWALTTKGWEMVETNGAPFIDSVQYARGSGMRRELLWKIFREKLDQCREAGLIDE